jgi:hypothetical protein
VCIFPGWLLGLVRGVLFRWQRRAPGSGFLVILVPEFEFIDPLMGMDWGLARALAKVISWLGALGLIGFVLTLATYGSQSAFPGLLDRIFGLRVFQPAPNVGALDRAPVLAYFILAGWAALLLVAYVPRAWGWYLESRTKRDLADE